MQVGEVNVGLGVDIGQFEAGLTRAMRSFQAFAKEVQSLNPNQSAANATAKSYDRMRGSADQARKAVAEQNQELGRGQRVLGAASVAVAGLTVKTIMFARESFRAAATVSEMNAAMTAIGRSTGVGGDKIKEAAQAIRKQGIEMAAAQNIAIEFAQGQIDLSKASQLARVAQDFAVIGQMNSTQAARTLTRAIMTGNSQLLKSVGINKYASEAYQDYADELGVTSAALTPVQRQQAILNMILEEGANVAGTYEAAMTEPGKVLRSFARIINDIAVEIGMVLTAGFGPLIMSTYELTKNFSLMLREGGVLHPLLKSLAKAMADFVAPLTKAVDSLASKIKTFNMLSTAMGSNVSVVMDKFKSFAPLVLSLSTSLSALAGVKILSIIPGLEKFAMLIGNAGPVGLGIATFIATSPALRSAFLEIVSALKPLIPTVKQIGGALLLAAESVTKAIDNIAKAATPAIAETVYVVAFALAQAAQAVAPLIVGLAKLVELLSQNKFVAMALGFALVGAFAAPKVIAGYSMFLNFGGKAVGLLSKMLIYTKLAAGQFIALKAAGMGGFGALKNVSAGLLTSLTGISGAALAAGAAFAPLVLALGWLQYEGAKNAEELRAKVEETNTSFRTQIDLLMKNKKAMVELKNVADPTMSVVEGTGKAATELREAFANIGTDFNYDDLNAINHNFELFAKTFFEAKGIVGDFADKLAAYAETGAFINDESLSREIKEEAAALSHVGEEALDAAMKLYMLREAAKTVNVFDQANKLSELVGVDAAGKALIEQAHLLVRARKEAGEFTDALGNTNEEAAAYAFTLQLTALHQRRVEKDMAATAKTGSALNALIFGMGPTANKAAAGYEALRQKLAESAITAGDVAAAIYETTAAFVANQRAIRGARKAVEDYLGDLGDVSTQEGFAESAERAYDALLEMTAGLINAGASFEEIQMSTVNTVKAFEQQWMAAGKSREEIDQLINSMGLLDGISSEFKLLLTMDVEGIRDKIRALQGLASDIAQAASFGFMDMAGADAMMYLASGLQKVVDTASTRSPRILSNFTPTPSRSGGGGGGAEAVDNTFNEFVASVAALGTKAVSKQFAQALLGTPEEIKAAIDELLETARAAGLMGIPEVRSQLQGLLDARGKLVTLSEERIRLANELATAEEKLAKAQERQQAVREMAGEFDRALYEIPQDKLDTILASVVEAQNKLGETQSRLADLRNQQMQFVVDFSRGLVGSFTAKGSITGQATKLLETARQFRDNIIMLASRGFPQDIISQVVGLGATEGNKLAKKLLAMSAGDLVQLRSIYGELQATAMQAAVITSDVLFGSDISQAQADLAQQEGVVRQLLRDAMTEADLQAAAAQARIDGLKTELQSNVDATKLLTRQLQTSFGSTLEHYLHVGLGVYNESLFSMVRAFREMLTGIGTGEYSFLDPENWRASQALLMGNVPGRAMGGMVMGGRPYMVGEVGPELFVPGRTGTIVPTSFAGGGSSTSNHYEINVNVAPGSNPGEVGRQIVEAIRQYERRNGSSWRG